MAVYRLGKHNTNTICETLYVRVYMCVGLCVGDAFQIYYCFCPALGRCTCVETCFITIILLLLLVIIIHKAEKYSRNIYTKKAS